MAWCVRLPPLSAALAPMPPILTSPSTQDPTILLDDFPRHMWVWLAVVLTPRALWRDKVELYVSGVRVCEKLARYPTMKTVSHAFVGGCVACGCLR